MAQQGAVGGNLSRKTERAARAFGDVVAAIGFLQLAGWVLLEALPPELVTVVTAAKVNTSLALVAVGLAISFGSRRWLRLGAGGLVILIASLTIAEYASGTSLGIDQLVHADPSPGLPFAGRMGLESASVLLLLGSALLLMRTRAVRVTEAIGVATFIVSFVVLYGRIFDAPVLSRARGLGPIAMQTAVALFLASIALTLVEPRHILHRLLADLGPAGRSIRVLVPFALTLPAAETLLHRTAEVSHNPLLLTGQAALFSLFFTTLIVTVAARLRRVDLQRSRALDAVRGLASTLQARVEERTAELARSEAHERLLADNTSDIVFRATADGTLTYVSPSIEPVLGYRPADVMSLSFEAASDLYSPGGGDVNLMDLLTKVVDAETTSHLAEVTRADGSTIWLDTRFDTVTDPVTGAETEIIGIARDVTMEVEAKRLLEERNEEMRRRNELAEFLRRTALAVGTADDLDGALTALGRSVHAVVPCDRVTLGVRAGPQVLRVAGVWGEGSDRLPAGATVELDRASFSQLEDGRALLTQDASRPGTLAERSAAAVGMNSYLAVPVVLIDGELRATISFSSSQPNAFPPEVALLLESVARHSGGTFTHLYLLEQEREIAERLRELDELKNDFLGVVAHDVRAPMAVVRLAAATLQRYPQLPDDKREELLHDIVTSTDVMTALITNTLDVAYIESGELLVRSEAFDLCELIDEVATHTRKATGRECLVACTEGLPMVYGDPGRVRQVLTNLISNGLKFSEPPLPVSVSIRERGSMLELAVRDHGPGIAPADLPKLFRKFSRITTDGAPRVPGTGLGLFICKSLVDAQGGEITVDSTVGEGTTFSFTVPIATEADGEAAAEAQVPIEASSA